MSFELQDVCHAAIPPTHPVLASWRASGARWLERMVNSMTKSRSALLASRPGRFEDWRGTPHEVLFPSGVNFMNGKSGTADTYMVFERLGDLVGERTISASPSGRSSNCGLPWSCWSIPTSQRRVARVELGAASSGDDAPLHASGLANQEATDHEH